MKSRTSRRIDTEKWRKIHVKKKKSKRVNRQTDESNERKGQAQGQTEIAEKEKNEQTEN